MKWWEMKKWWKEEIVRNEWLEEETVREEENVDRWIFFKGVFDFFHLHDAYMYKIGYRLNV